MMGAGIAPSGGTAHAAAIS